LSEVDETSILKLGLPTPLRLFSQLVTVSAGRRPIGSCIPRSGLLRSDFVPWPKADSLLSPCYPTRSESKRK
jgi:hypothetical protein